MRAMLLLLLCVSAIAEDPVQTAMAEAFSDAGVKRAEEPSALQQELLRMQEMLARQRELNAALVEEMEAMKDTISEIQPAATTALADLVKKDDALEKLHATHNAQKRQLATLHGPCVRVCPQAH